MAPAKITINRNGSICIEGDFTIHDAKAGVRFAAAKSSRCAAAVIPRTNPSATATTRPADSTPSARRASFRRPRLWPTMIQFVQESDRELIEDALRFAQSRCAIPSRPILAFIRCTPAMGAGSTIAVWSNWSDGFLPESCGSSTSALAVIVSKIPTGWSTLFSTRRPWSLVSTTAKRPTSASFFCPPITAGINSRAIRNSKRYRSGRGDQALRFQESGQYLQSSAGESSDLHRRHDERGHRFLCRARNGRPPSARHRAAPLLDHAPLPGTGDGSTAHEGMFDTATGEFLRQTTQQGYRGDSCWSRGLARALNPYSAQAKPRDQQESPR